MGDIQTDERDQNRCAAENPLEMRDGGLRRVRAEYGSKKRAKAAQAFSKSDPAATNREQGQNHERAEHRPGALMRMRIVRTHLTEEGHVPQPEHVKRSEQRSDETDEPQNLAARALDKGRVENRVFREE